MKKEFEEYKKELEQQNSISNIKNNVLTDKIYDFLTENNKINEKYLTREEMEAKLKEENETQESDEQNNKQDENEDK